MQTQLAADIADTPRGREADAILRSCVHCGFCTATCPTYQLLGDEDDGPRGRIYLIKAVLEGHPPGPRTQLHLDRCLTCRACETTCPSGVNYHRLLDIGRAEVERTVGRPPAQRLLRAAMLAIMPERRWFSPLLRIGQWLRPLLPGALREKIPARGTRRPVPAPRHTRTVILLEGCVQPAMAPNINDATARVLDALGISLARAPGAGCCGALRHHLGAEEAARHDMRRNIDAWWPVLAAGAEAVLVNTSGCAPQVKDYAVLLADDPAYAQKAAHISQRTLDIAQLLAREKTALLARLGEAGGMRKERSVAFHSPCTLQHGQGITGVVEELLTAAGCRLQPVADSHLCCGSAGTYSIFQPALSRQLRANKAAALTAGRPAEIATANIGCLTHLQPAVDVPVKHWIEIIDEALAAAPG